MVSLVIDADGHVEENLAELVGAIPAAMQPNAMRFVAVAGGHVTYEIEGRLWRSTYRTRAACRTTSRPGASVARAAAIPRFGCRSSRTRASTPPCSIRASG